MRSTPLLLAGICVAGLTPAAGCTSGDNNFGYEGRNINDYVALDGERDWELASESESYAMLIEKVLPTESKGDTEVVTLEYAAKEPYALLYGIKWSSDASSGVQIHAYKVEGEHDSYQTFDPPIKVSAYRANIGDVETTDTDKGTFVSTYDGFESCPNLWVSEDWDCVVFTIDDGGAGTPFAGTHWWAADWMTSRFLPAGASDPWILTNGHWASID